MILQQMLIWPMECPDELTDVPQCWNVSLNLGNKFHKDNDGNRSFAVWVSNNKDTSSTSWYLLFPEWEVAIEICHGTWISWNEHVQDGGLARPRRAHEGEDLARTGGPGHAVEYRPGPCE